MPSRWSPNALARLASSSHSSPSRAAPLLCPLAGKLADRLGKARTTIVFMVLSGASAVIAAGSFGGSVGVFTLAVLLWGLSVIPDSAQFSALIADFAPPEKAGSLMTLQTACGFALTIITVQATPWLATQIGWPGVFLVLACGPAFGVWSMWALQAEGARMSAAVNVSHLVCTSRPQS